MPTGSKELRRQRPATTGAPRWPESGIYGSADCFLNMGTCFLDFEQSTFCHSHVSAVWGKQNHVFRLRVMFRLDKYS